MEDVRKAFPRVGCSPLIYQIRDRKKLFVRFLISDVYLGTLHLLQDDLYDELCPVCGEDLSRIHILVHCKGLELERQILHRMIPASHLTDFQWLAQHGEKPLSTFLSMVQARFAMAGSITVRSSTRSVSSSVA